MSVAGFVAAQASRTVVVADTEVVDVDAVDARSSASRVHPTLVARAARQTGSVLVLHAVTVTWRRTCTHTHLFLHDRTVFMYTRSTYIHVLVYVTNLNTSLR